jgi:hypothetical protein
MISTAKFVESLSGEVAKKWVDRLISPAFLYWLAVLAAYFSSLPDSKLNNILEAGQRALETPNVPIIILGIVTGLLLVVGSAALIEALQFTGLRILEGYWPRMFDPIANRLRRRVQSKLSTMDSRWEALSRTYAKHDSAKRLQYMRLDRERGLYPENPDKAMPTRLGNILREAETYAQRRYGLAAVMMWPRLWLVLPEAPRQDIARAQARLDGAVRYVLWSVALAPWSLRSLWVLPVSLVGVMLSYRYAVSQAATFGQLLKATFDVYHRTLFEALGQNPSKSTVSQNSKEVGESITLFIKRGIHRSAAHEAASKPPVNMPARSITPLVMIGVAFAVLRFIRGHRRAE